MMGKLPRVTLEEMQFALSLMQLARDCRIPVRNPESIGFSIKDENGDVEDFTLGDHPYNRSILALLDNFDPEKAYALAMRVSVLTRLLEREEFRQPPYFKDTGDTESIMISDVFLATVCRVGVYHLQMPQTADVVALFNKVAKRMPI